MELLQKLEDKLIERLDKKAPVRMPEGARKDLASAAWILALVLGVLQLWAVFNYFALDMLSGVYVPAFVYAYGGFFYFLSMILLTISSVMLLVSASGLKARQKDGWNLLFYALLLNAAYGVVRLFAGYGGFGALLWAAVTTVIAAYFIFQVRDQFLQRKTHKSSK